MLHSRPQGWAPEPLEEEAIDRPPEKPRSVLLAEDDDEARDLLASELRQDGFVVLEAKDGFHLVNLLKGALHLKDPFWKPDLIITDIRMPGCTGLQALDEIRKEDGFTPVILITAYGDEEARRQAERLGVAALFDKPFDLEDFKIAVFRLARPDNRLDSWLRDLETGVGD